MSEFAPPAYVKPGATLRLFWGEGHPGNRLIHIRAIVDDEYVVYRWWSRRNGWLYKIEWGHWFEMVENNITLVKRGDRGSMSELQDEITRLQNIIDEQAEKIDDLRIALERCEDAQATPQEDK